MCGIAGFWNRDGKVASEVLLGRMLERINHRGPDDQGTWTQGGIGLGHCRLSILDLSMKGHQPFLTKDESGVISYNGEVYNFMELKRDLEKDGVHFQSKTDTEVVLYALHLWGPEKAIKLFNGMFAFAYFDRRNQTLWLSRDRTGIKPLYFAEQGSIVAFASEMKALLAHPVVTGRPNMHALTTHIMERRLVGTWSPFEGVESIQPGTLLKITGNAKQEITYFDVLRDVNIDRILQAENRAFDSLVDDFKNYFSSSVKMHLISDAPLALMCSGGLDSSLVTAYAKEFKSDLVAYVADIKEVGIPEGPKAKKVCDHVNIELRQVDVGAEEYLRLWPEAVFANDQPNFFPQNVPTLAVCQAARRDGFKVMLSGEGSDELFGGYPWYVDAYKMWRARRVHMQMVPDFSLLRKLGQFARRLTPLDFDELKRKPFKHLTDEEPLTSDLRSICAIDGAQRHLKVQALFEKLNRVQPLEARAFLARELADFYTQLPTLLRTNDKMGMAASIEVRVPFLENRLIDFALHLPSWAKYRKGVTKRIVKRVAEACLPHEIVHARKIGFGVSATLWRRPATLLKNGMVQHLFKWGMKEAEQIYELALSDDSLVYQLLCMELWARIYLSGESTAELSEQLLKFSHDNRTTQNKPLELAPSASL